MDAQMSLFQENNKSSVKIVKKEKSQAETFIYEYEETNDEYNAFQEKYLAEKKNSFVIFVNYNCIREKTGQILEEGLKTSFEVERPFREDKNKDSFGGSWGVKTLDTISKDEIDNFVAEFLEEKKRYCDYGYVEHGHGLYTIDIHWDYMKLIITEKAKQFLSKFIDVNALLKSWDDIKGHDADNLELEKENRYNSFAAECDLLNDELEETEKILRQRCCIKYEYHFESQIKETEKNKHWFTMSLDDLVIERKKKIDRKKYLKRELHFMRWIKRGLIKKLNGGYKYVNRSR